MKWGHVSWQSRRLTREDQSQSLQCGPAGFVPEQSHCERSAGSQRQACTGCVPGGDAKDGLQRSQQASSVYANKASSPAVIIEDAVNGLKAAKAAGAFSIGITNTVSRETLEPHADLVVDSLQEVLKLLDEPSS
eukprot:scaffold66847_cov40-Prasinocladus_malaysianus.AAC.1